MSFTGKYEGTLWYSESYPSTHLDAELTFQMEIEEENGSFSGIAIDLEGVGKSPEEAVVVGEIDSERISFDKGYKHLHYADEEGNVIIDDKLEGYPIFYDGIFNKETGYYEGTWKYNVFRRYWLFFTKPVDGGSGTFRLKKM